MSKARGWRNRITGVPQIPGTTATKDTVFCQQCKNHSNNPSYCRLYKSPVSRKRAMECQEFKRA